MSELLKQSTNKAVLKLAIPAIFSFLFIVLYEMVDTYWLNRLNYTGVFAALGAASFITWSLYSLMHIVTTGVNSLISQRAGAKDKEGYFSISGQGYLLSIGVSLIITLIMHLIHRKIFILSGLEGRVLEDACEYFRIMNLGYIFIFLFNCNGVIFNAHGDTKTAMLIQATMLTLNCIVDPIFILGKFGIPAMGIKGAAVASILCQFCGFIAGFFILIKKDLIRLKIQFFNNLNQYKKIFSIGIPIALVNWVFAMVYPVLTYLISGLNNMEALGALNICHKIEGFAYFTGIGFSVASSTLAGQHKGNGDTNKAIKSVNRCALLCSAVLSIFSILFIFFPDKIISLLVDSPEIISEGANYLRIIGIFELFMGLEIVYEGGFTGLGNTYYPMLISIPLTLLRLPLGYLFGYTLEMGVTGIWIAISFSTFLKGVIVSFMFQKKSIKIK